MPELKLDKNELERLKNAKILSMIGFAARAGKLISGTDRICDEVRRHGSPDDGEGRPWSSPGIVILTADASDNTKKRLVNACTYYRVELYRSTMTQEELAARIGKAASAACATFDRGFADGIRKAIDPQGKSRRRRA